MFINQKNIISSQSLKWKGGKKGENVEPYNIFLKSAFKNIKIS